jgi:putative membrane protein
MPEMILPLLFVGCWSTLIVCISHFKHYRKYTYLRVQDFKLTLNIVGINSVLLTVLGFVVGLGLSFRSSTAYERYYYLALIENPSLIFS